MNKEYGGWERFWSFLKGFGLANVGVIVVVLGIAWAISIEGLALFRTGEEAPIYVEAVGFLGLAIMFFGPFVFWVVGSIITVVRRYRHGSRFIWRVIGLAIVIKAAIAVVTGFVALFTLPGEPVLWGILVLLPGLPLSFLVIVPAILEKQRRKRRYSIGELAAQQ